MANDPVSDLILLTSDRGQQLLAEAKAGPCHQGALFNIFRKQKGSSNCGIQSSALVLGAHHLHANTDSPPGDKDDEFIESMPFNEMKMFSFKHTPDFLIDTDNVHKRGGTTLAEVATLLKGFDHCKVTTYFAEDSNVEEFRKVAKEVLGRKDSSTAIIVNYHMESIGQPMPFGHHSPLSAYHEETDRFLIQDTWYETVEPWTKADSLFMAMCHVDSASKKSRGYIVVDFTK